MSIANVPRPALQRAATAVLLLCVAGSVGCGGSRVEELIAQLQRGDDASRRTAARELGTLGAGAIDAQAALTEALSADDGELRRVACVALGQIGASRQSAPALREQLNDETLSIRMAAAFALQKIDPADESFVPVLTGAMEMGEGGTIVAVGNLGPEADWAVPTLIALLRDHRPGIRRLSATALGRIAPGSDDVKAALEKALHDPDDRVRHAAREALQPPR